MTIKRTVAQLLLWGAPLVAGQTLAPAVFAQGQPQLTEQQKAEERAKKRGPQTPPPQKQPQQQLQQPRVQTTQPPPPPPRKDLRQEVRPERRDARPDPLPERRLSPPPSQAMPSTPPPKLPPPVIQQRSVQPPAVTTTAPSPDPRGRDGRRDARPNTESPPTKSGGSGPQITPPITPPGGSRATIVDPNARGLNSRGPGASPTGTPLPAAANIRRIDDLASQRQVRTEAGGRRRITEEPGNRTIIRQDNRVIIRNNDSDRFSRFGSDIRTERRRDGRNVTVMTRPGGVQVSSIYDTRGNLVERRRRGPDGRDVLLIDNRRIYGRGAAIVGAGALIGLAIALAAPRMTIPRHHYITEYDRASPDELYETLWAPPVDRLPRRYALEEIRYSHSVREYARRIDLDSITFESGSWEVPHDQRNKLEAVARAMRRVLDRRPEDVFLIEGHTDATGDQENNLTLSDRRAESVAAILTEFFDIPPENLVTQGYGEQYLKVNTDGPDRINRRVAIRNITGLMARDGER